MAFTRKFLAALGIEADKVDEIINAHTEVTDALKSERDRYREDAEKLPGVQKELDEMKAAADKAGKDPYKVKYEALKEDFDKYKADQTARETAAAKSAAYKALLKEAGISEKRLDAVLKVSDLSKVELTEEGKVKDADTLAAAIRTEWADFIATPGKKGADPATPPPGGTPDYDSMSDAEHYAATYANKK